MTHLLLSLLMTAPADAHPDKDAPRTLIDGHGVGGYGAPVFGITTIDGQPAIRFGGRGGWVANRSFGVGLFGESISTTGSGTDVSIRQGGLFLEGYLGARYPVHGVIEAGLGIGDVSWGDTNGLGFTPFAGARLELNLVTWMRASVGPSVQLLIAQDVIPDDASQLGYGGDIVFKFGAF